MKIGAGINYPYPSQRPQVASAERPASTSFSAALTAASTSSARPADFTSMTRQDMRDWVNTQIRSGEMSLDDSRPFMAMTMKIPVSGAGAELSVENDRTRYDFMQQVRDGILGARSRNDETTLNMLESAISIMLRQPRQAGGVDQRA
ncbi:hypothetical protein [Massilia sp. YIM B02443]|uniref:hypothetical protein n=1 Tax=Massilia sp. YIM B02443 TaxID=3050127 RepID=UPI0025B64AB8|nr:hypothetical protein [Massilia sp. YIM B02443]MDN4038711.1 hypothetical protein [Massilia sp. YIM B02443]